MRENNPECKCVGEHMSDEKSAYIDRSVMSDCCGAPAVGEVINESGTLLGICSDCKDHATFERENEKPNKEVV